MPEKKPKYSWVETISCHANSFSSFLLFTCSAKVAEEKIRYAAYNCLAIDTDVSPWEE